MNTLEEEQPSSVSARAKQDGETPARWAWVEPTVWTSRMLAALENRVKERLWFSLMDKVYAPANLAAAWKRVRSNRGAAGVDRQSVEMFERHAPNFRWPNVYFAKLGLFTMTTARASARRSLQGAH